MRANDKDVPLIHQEVESIGQNNTNINYLERECVHDIEAKKNPTDPSNFASFPSPTSSLDKRVCLGTEL
jgi:hypothetical protein